jgi:hypothetical protein
MNTKADYVRAADQTRKHHCHWPGCDAQVPLAKWGCKTHWFRLPKHLRENIWGAFEPGQEENGTSSRAYIAAAREAQQWIAANAPPDLFDN